MNDIGHWLRITKTKKLSCQRKYGVNLEDNNMIAERMCPDWQRIDHYQSKLCIFIDKDNL